MYNSVIYSYQRRVGMGLGYGENKETKATENSPGKNN